jgi:D-3-phosphoglycerate dehydrogenase
VVVADSIALDGLTPLRDDPRFTLDVRARLSPDELADALVDADAVLVRSATRITRESLARANRLKAIGRAGVGVDTIDVDAATERGIPVLTAPAGNTTSAAELTLALLLSLVRRVAAADRSMHAGEWERGRFAGVELHGKVLGLIGAGRIGGEVAIRARAFGMRVLVHDPFLNAERALALGVESVSLDDVIERVDVLSVHVPLTEQTEGLIDAAAIARMKPGAIILNVARGGIVNEDALVEALQSGQLRGAALDVFAQEPLPADHVLRTLPNVVLTPHLGASTAEAQQNVALEIADAVRSALLEGDLSRAVNAPVVGGEDMRRLRPLLPLARSLGRLAMALADGPLAHVEVRYAGRLPGGLRMIAASAVSGALSTALDEDGVNLVNALPLATSRGISVDQVRLDPTAAFPESIEVRVRTDTGSHRTGGALLGDSYERILQVDDFRVDMPSHGALLVLRNRDVPGVIGRVGTLLGAAGVNIAGYHQSRLAAGGDALAVIAVDAAPDARTLSALRGLDEVSEARFVAL